ncbi:MAG TPA: Uma2 family endonuclease [Gemmatimonadales bacterium]|nr:Uma2 family endonuclease [Gemmatimonadales bacterium]
MPAPEPPVTTIEQLLALPDDRLRHELLDGVHVVSPAPRPRHQIALGKLWSHLLEVTRTRLDVYVFSSPADIVLGPKTLVQPDLFVVRRTPGKRLERWADVGVPLLAMEILSSTTALRDRGAKRRIYQRAGVAEYWIVDVDARLIERWRPEDTRPEIVDEALEWTLPGGASGRLDVRRLFLEVWEE